MKYLIMLCLLCSMKLYAQVPLRSYDVKNEDMILYASATQRINLGLDHTSTKRVRRNGKALIYSGLGAMALGMLGMAYASGPDLRNQYLINDPEWALIAAFTPLDGMLYLASMGVVATGITLTTIGTVKYIRSGKNIAKPNK